MDSGLIWKVGGVFEEMETAVTFSYSQSYPYAPLNFTISYLGLNSFSDSYVVILQSPVAIHVLLTLVTCPNVFWLLSPTIRKP